MSDKRKEENPSLSYPLPEVRRSGLNLTYGDGERARPAPASAGQGGPGVRGFDSVGSAYRAGCSHFLRGRTSETWGRGGGDGPGSSRWRTLCPKSRRWKGMSSDRTFQAPLFDKSLAKFVGFYQVIARRPSPLILSSSKDEFIEPTKQSPVEADRFCLLGCPNA